jgi:ribose transport system ATP-binding protein
LEEVRAIADRVAVLRDGKNAGALRGDDVTHENMIQLMVGRDLKNFYSAPGSSVPGVAFRLHKLRTRRYPKHEVSLDIRTGEILAIAGLVGAGRSELGQAVFGVEPPLSGSVLDNGAPLKIQSPRHAIAHGIYLVPEDRRDTGLITEMTVRENITLPSVRRHSSSGWIRRERENATARKMCEALKVKTTSIETVVTTLSGGNQQKVALAKWLALKPRLIFFDEPTRGIDVGAKSEIYQIMRRLAQEGVAVVMISSDMEEILGNSDRVAVMHDGRITGVLTRDECSQEAIMRLAVA